MTSKTETNESSAALGWTGSVCSIVGLVFVIVLQSKRFDNYIVLFWWLTTMSIAIAAISTCFNPPSLLLRVVFAIVFVAQLPVLTSLGVRFMSATPRYLEVYRFYLWSQPRRKRESKDLNMKRRSSNGRTIGSLCNGVKPCFSGKP